MQSVKACSQYDVVIAGGSYIGLCMALGLAREIGPDLRIAVVDRGGRSVQPPATEGVDPRASAISAGSINLLRALGIWQQVEDAATPVTSIELTDSSLNAGVRRPLLTYDNVAADGEPASYILPNAELAVALERSVTACASITRVFSASVSGFQTDAGRSVVVFDDGRRFETEFAIAADGRRSGLREAAGIGTVGWDYDQTGIVTTITHDADHHNRAIQHFLPGGPFALLPLKGGHRSCITWSETATEAKRIMALDNAAFLEEVDVRVAGRLDTVKLDGPRKSWPLEAHLARSYIGTRLAVIGDAAHGVHPIGGQGLNLGFRDVAALIECIADAARVGLSLGDADALARYERWRRFDSAMSSAAYTGLNKLFSNDMALVRSVREVGLGILDKLPGVKRMLVDEAAGLSGELPRLLRASPVM